MPAASRIVILSTSDIQSRRPYTPDQSPTTEATEEGRTVRFYSTGRLEKAVALGLTVHVATTREAQEEGTHDGWWRRLVEQSGGKLFFATPNRDKQEAYRSGWRACLASLGHEWPTRTIIADRGPEPIHWMEVQQMIDHDEFPGLISRVQLDRM